MYLPMMVMSTLRQVIEFFDFGRYLFSCVVRVKVMIYSDWCNEFVILTAMPVPGFVLRDMRCCLTILSLYAEVRVRGSMIGVLIRFVFHSGYGDISVPCYDY